MYKKNKFHIYFKNQVFAIKNSNYSSDFIKQKLKNFKIFRKGPFYINEVYIPSQWNSYIKWKYLEKILDNYVKNKLLPSFQNEIQILDIGSNNGYYSFLIYYYLKKHSLYPNITLVDPTQEFYYQFKFLKTFFPEEDQSRWKFLVQGWQNLKLIPKKWDLILCMGLLYHTLSPVELLQTLQNILNTKGILILETITIQYGEFPILLIPEKKYAGSSGMWWIPNQKAVFNLLKRTNFRDIRFHNERFIWEEMQRIQYLPGLKDVIVTDSNYTIEGYPKPYRSFFTAIK